jgi:hypothetical protein
MHSKDYQNPAVMDPATKRELFLVPLLWEFPSPMDFVT